jgi:hypothetical protein
MHVVVPGLLGPLPGSEAEGVRPDVPVLETLLSRSAREEVAGQDYVSTLFGLFGVAEPRGADWPSAAVCGLADDRATQDGCWFHADPVHLEPDADRLLLFDAESLAIGEDEATHIAGLVDDHFSAEGWHLEVAAADRWYLRLRDCPSVTTRPLQDVIGRDMHPFLPSGREASKWRGLLNELQMLLFHARDNERRREQGRPLINGVWLWGGGRLPRAPGRMWSHVLSDHPLARGLGILAGAEAQPLGTGNRGDGPDGDCLVFHHGLLRPIADLDFAAWCRELETLEADLCRFRDRVRAGRQEALLLYPCNGQRYRVTRSSLRKLWRRPRPIGSMLASARF